MAMSTGTSKYVAVREHLLGRISQLEPGTRMPPEPVLCDEYGVSRITLRHAVDGLVADGVLVREHGRGTFVVEPHFPVRYRERFADAVTGFYSQQTDEGFTVTTQVLSQRVCPLGVVAAARLGVNPADPGLELTRLRFVNGALHHHVRTWLPMALFPSAVDVDFTDGSLYGYLATEFGIELRRNDVLVSVEPAAEDVASHLHVPVGEKLLTVTSTVFDADDRAIAHGTSRFTPANSEISFDLHL